MDYIVEREDGKAYLNFMYQIDGYCTFELIVNSEKFKGVSTMTFSCDKIEKGIRNLDLLWKGENVQFRIDDYDSQMYIAVSKHDERYLLYGRLDDSGGNYTLEYKMVIDQSSVKLFYDILYNAYISIQT